MRLTQALDLRMGGNPFGLASTGKTGSVKAMGNQLGRSVKSSQSLLPKYIEQDAKAGAIKPVRRAGWEWAASFTLAASMELRGLSALAQVRA